MSIYDEVPITCCGVHRIRNFTGNKNELRSRNIVQQGALKTVTQQRTFDEAPVLSSRVRWKRSLITGHTMKPDYRSPIIVEARSAKLYGSTVAAAARAVLTAPGTVLPEAGPTTSYWRWRDRYNSNDINAADFRTISTWADSGKGTNSF